MRRIYQTSSRLDSLGYFLTSLNMVTISSVPALFSRVLSRLLVIDPAASDSQQLLERLRPGYEALVLDRQWDGVTQISEALADCARAGVPLVRLHVLSHSSPGMVYLGSGELSLTFLSLESPEAHAPQVRHWGAVVDVVDSVAVMWRRSRHFGRKSVQDEAVLRAYAVEPN